MRRPVLALTALLLATSCGDEERVNPRSWTLASDAARVELRLDSFGMKIEDASGKTLLDTLDEDPGVAGDDAHAYGALGGTSHGTTIKKSVIEGFDHVQGVDAPWHHATSVAAASLDASTASLDLFDPADPSTIIHLEVAVVGPEVRVDARVVGAPEDQTAFLHEDPTGTLNQLGQSFQLPADEHFFGLGERLVTVDHRGRHYECWVEEGGIAQGESAPPGPTNPAPNGPSMSHVPVPFYLSSRGYGLWIDTTYRAGFSFGAEDPRYSRLYVASPELHFRVLVHADPRDTLAHYTALTGRAQLPARWVFGPRRRTDPGTLVDGVPELQAFRARKVPTTMVDDTRHFLPIAAEKGDEPTLAKWTKDAHALGYKPIAYFNAYVSVNDPRAADDAKYGRDHGYFVKLDDGSEFDTFMISSGPQTVATIDMTNPDAVDWYHTILKRALDLGYDGWMLDFGEYLPQRAVMHDGRTGWEAHNAFPLVYQSATVDWLREVRGDDFMFFARAGWAGTQARVPVVWSGDPAASYDDAKGLPAQVRAGLNAGISGLPYWGSDISGYSCNVDPPPDKELYLRWAEFGAFSTDMHDENACAAKPAGAPDKWTLWSDAETTKVYGDYARLHTRLNPYLYAAAKEAADTGFPVMRHPVLVHPDRAEAFAVEHEYYFGPALYVAPVVRRGAVKRELWLPPGTWFDWWTLQSLEGGKRVTRDAPLATLPLFLRSGGVVAMLDPSIETLAPETSPDVVGPADVAGVLDVRAALDVATGRGHAELVGGTALDLTLAAGAVALPAGFAPAANEAELATCTSCGLVDPLLGGTTRVRVSGASSSDESLAAGALTLHHHGVDAVRVRWDVAVLAK